MKRLQRVLVANRGEIAVRCIRACKEMSVESVAIFTGGDSHSLHVRAATVNVLLPGEGPSAYTDIDNILRICSEHSVDAVIPGYGFLSESAEFSRRVEEAGMIFVGPNAQVINSMGLKHTARELAISANVPVIKGSGLLKDAAAALEATRSIGFPVILKASGGGGGMGQQICYGEADITDAFANVDSRSKALFKDAGVFLERYYPQSHHIEVQVFGNGSDVVHFGERECSIQRRHQKVIEECPSPHLREHPALRDRLTSCAVSLAKLINYRSAGTVEFLVDDESEDFFFLEMNTRLQVEHGVTELCYGVDIVQLMLRQAECQFQGVGGIEAKEMKILQMKANNTRGSAIEVRVCAENPADGFVPCSGIVQGIDWPIMEGLRIDTWIQTGTTISPYFDSLLGKIMVHRDTREETISVFQEILQLPMIYGITTNLTFASAIMASGPFLKGATLTTFLDHQFNYRPRGLLVLEPGAMTTIQQPRQRMKGYGVPPSGPMDDLSAVIANLLVANPTDTECLEIFMLGPELRFDSAAVVAVTGASFHVTLNGQRVETWSRVQVRAGDTLNIGQCVGRGARCYLAVKGGFPEVPQWLGSKSTTPSLALGGLQGRQLRPRDYLNLATHDEEEHFSPCQLPESMTTKVSDVETIYVMQGPHDSDDFITASGRQALYSSDWTIDHNCSRTGIRLIGPKIEWSRINGGVGGGAHPSNVIDYPYPSPGGINWTGDSPVIFPSDGPGFGGFLCSSTVPSAELWKLGQLSPGAKIRLLPVSYNTARSLVDGKERLIKDVESFISQGTQSAREFAVPQLTDIRTSDAILEVIAKDGSKADLTLRQGGDSFIIIDLALDEVGLHATVRAQMLARALREASVQHMFIHVNISSIMVEYDANHVEQASVVELIKATWAKSSALNSPVGNRRLRLPIVFDHPSIQDAHERYAILQRDKAVYMPDNVTYLQRNNALASRADVFRLLGDMKLLVVAVGFMTGLPLLLPLDPLARLVAQKYNPTRISTPPGTVGFGGSLFCIYPAEQPGGYMMLARTVPVWDTYSIHPSFSADKPWLCEPFDQVEFYEVSIGEFDKTMKAFETGTFRLDIQPSVFDVPEELAREVERRDLPEVLEFQRRQREAAETMRLQEQALYMEWSEDQAKSTVVDMDTDNLGSCVKVASSQAGKLWKIQVSLGDRVKIGQTLVVLEAMKMEVAVTATSDHEGLIVERIVSKEGSLVVPGSVILILGPQH